MISRSGSSARVCETDEQRKEMFRWPCEPTDIYYGIGLGPGKGATPQMADAQGGSGDGVGIRKLLPCFEGEQFGSVAGLHVMQAPVKVLMSG